MRDPRERLQDILEAIAAIERYHDRAKAAFASDELLQTWFLRHLQIIGYDRDFAAHVDYVHFNPVRHGYVSHAAEWLHSTFRACVRRGLYPEAWLGSASPGLSVRQTGE